MLHNAAPQTSLDMNGIVKSVTSADVAWLISELEIQRMTAAILAQSQGKDLSASGQSCPACG